MFTEKTSATGSRLIVTTLATLGWMAWLLGWLAFAWSGHSFPQNLASVGTFTLLFTAVVAVLWVGNLRCTPLATTLVTLGWISFMLY